MCSYNLISSKKSHINLFSTKRIKWDLLDSLGIKTFTRDLDQQNGENYKLLQTRTVIKMNLKLLQKPN